MFTEPGGYLQWDESDPASLHPEPTDPSVAHPYYDELHALMAPWLTARGFTYKQVFSLISSEPSLIANHHVIGGLVKWISISVTTVWRF